MRQISKKMKLIIFLVILIIIVGTASFYSIKFFQIDRTQLSPIVNFEEKSNANLNNTENLATSSPESKIVLSEHYYKDSIDVYFDDNNGGKPFKVDNADLESFKVFDDKSDYSADINNVYYRGTVLTGADVRSFKKLEGEKCLSAYGYYYADKNHVYSRGEIISSNPGTFICLGEGWSKDQNNYYFVDELASFNYQDKMIYFENIVGEGREPGLGGTDTNTYILDKKTGSKKKIFDFGRSSPGGETLPGISKTNHPNILKFTYSTGDACGFYQKSWDYNTLNNKILKIEFLSGCGFSDYQLTINNDILVKELIDFKGCISNCQNSCQDLKPILKDITVNEVPQKLFSGKDILKCENVDFWDANSSMNYVGTNSDFSEVYFTVSIGTWDEKESKNIILTEYKLSYNVPEKRIIIVNDFPNLLTTDQIKEQTYN